MSRLHDKRWLRGKKYDGQNACGGISVDLIACGSCNSPWAYHYAAGPIEEGSCNGRATCCKSTGRIHAGSCNVTVPVNMSWGPSISPVATLSPLAKGISVSSTEMVFIKIHNFFISLLSLLQLLLVPIVGESQ